MNVYIYACVHTCARTHIYTHSFSDSFHSRLLHIKYSSLCYMVGLCCLPILYIVSITLCLVAQLYLTLCNTKDCVFEELGRLLCPWGFSRQEYWSAFPCPPPGDLPNPGTEPRSHILQADSLLSESPGKHTKCPTTLKKWTCLGWHPWIGKEGLVVHCVNFLNQSDL